MTKHGFSHAAGTLTSVVAAGLLVRQIDAHVPGVMGQMTHVSQWLIKVLGLSMSVSNMRQLLVAGSLAFIWGVAFKATVDR